LVVLIRDRNPYFRCRNYNFIGHLINGNWLPYTVDPYQTQVGAELDSSASIRTLTTIDEVINNLAEGQELPFVLANGNFPRGCGLAPFSPCLIIGREHDSFEDISSEVINQLGYNAALERRATGRMNLENQLRINDFSSRYLERPRDYADAITSISQSYLAPEGTAILFKANL
jgi:hypothetical protein